MRHLLMAHQQESFLPFFFPSKSLLLPKPRGKKKHSKTSWSSLLSFRTVWSFSPFQNRVALSLSPQNLVVLSLFTSEPHGPLPFPSEPHGSLFTSEPRGLLSFTSEPHGPLPFPSEPPGTLLFYFRTAWSTIYFRAAWSTPFSPKTLWSSPFYGCRT